VTERWRKKLEGIDQVAPRDDVYERAKAGATLPESRSPMQRTSTRVATAIAAFVVFALAISLFAIPTLRLRDDSSALSAGGQLLPLWPARTVEQVQALQDEADAGHADWALDPRQVGTRFGQAVLGWPDAWAGGVSSIAPTCGVLQGTYPNTASPAIPCASAAGSNSLAGVPGADPGTDIASCDPAFLLCGQATGGDLSSGPPSPFISLAVAVCDPSSCHASPTETLELFQPIRTGDGRIWAVFEASSPSIDLAVSPGQTVREGSSISTGARIRTGAQFGFGVHIGASGSCSLNKATDVYHGPLSTDGLMTSAGSEIGTDFGPSSGTSCQQSEPGYVFAATSGKPIVRDGIASDPLQPGGASLYALSAVPITFEWPDEVASPVPPTPATATGWTAYTDPLGFTIHVPSDWGITDVTGELIVSAPGGDPYVQINRVPNDPLRDDSSFPLNYAAMANDPQAHFRGGGQAFIIQWLTGDGSAPTPEQAAQFDRITRSIAFPATTLGAVEGGWTAVDPIFPSASAEWVTYKLTGDHYIAALTAGGARTAFGPAPTCPGGGGSYEVRETGVAGIACSNGTGGDWDFTTGEPKPGNSAGFDVPLHAWPALRSWDGWLLLQLPTGPTPTPSPP
jgi:hypothetical protein